MGDRIVCGVGAHEPIFHRMRTGHATAEEWERWERETSEANLDLLSELGVTHALIACTKGFGLEYEKPLIERAARFAEAAGRRGIATSVYVHGYAVYIETFFLQMPQARDWLARGQDGDVLPWGGQTFRRWIDPTRREFHEYHWMVHEYILRQFTPAMMYMDNTSLPPCYTDSCTASFRRYLREKHAGTLPVREFGIPSFEAVELPRFHPVYHPQDAYRIVKDPLLQEWTYWRSRVTAEFLAESRRRIRAIAPSVRLACGAGADGLRHNNLFNIGVDFDDRLAAADYVDMEEAGWRPGAIEPTGQGAARIFEDTRAAAGHAAAATGKVRVSTDSRWPKICEHYGIRCNLGFWGEAERAARLVALAHNFAFAADPTDLGRIGPLAAAPGMFDDIADVVRWGNDHLAVLTGRDKRFAPVAVWRGTATLAFIRHRPVWEACAVEQMLYENHLPFTIVLDGSLEKALGEASVLVLPGTACVSDRQVEKITDFVSGGGSLLLLGPAGTRDHRTRLRRRYAFEHLFGGAMPNLEHFGPPHWVPQLNLAAMPQRLAGSFGAGKVALVRDIAPAAPLDETRDPYSPERRVASRDVLPPANEAAILRELTGLLGEVVGVDGPRWTLCEYWRRGGDLLVCCANLSQTRDGGPLTVRLPGIAAEAATVRTLLEDGVREEPIRAGKIGLESLRHFCAVEVKDAFA